MTPDLSQLRDIHLPPPVSWWPPAPVWWLIPVICLFVCAAVYLLYRRRKLDQWRRSALLELARLRHQPSHLAVSALSVLLRRVAISRFSPQDVASLSGEQWLAFLDKTGGAGFMSAQGRLLVVAPYVQEMHIAPAEMEKLFMLCERWISQLPAGDRS